MAILTRLSKEKTSSKFDFRFLTKNQINPFFQTPKNTVFTGDEIVAGFACKIQILDSGKKILVIWVTHIFISH